MADPKYIVSQAVYEAYKSCLSQGSDIPDHLVPCLYEAIIYLYERGYFNENTI